MKGEETLIAGAGLAAPPPRCSRRPALAGRALAIASVSGVAGRRRTRGGAGGARRFGDLALPSARRAKPVVTTLLAAPHAARDHGLRLVLLAAR